MVSIVRKVAALFFLFFILFLNLNLNLSFPSAAAAAEWTYYAADADGAHYYWVESQPSPGVVRAWGHLVYSPGGRDLYLAKRKGAGMSTEGFGKVNHRNVLYELNCFSERGEYAILEILEMTKEGTRLDYAKVGTYKEWHFVPEGSTLEKLCKGACPPRRQ